MRWLTALALTGMLAASGPLPATALELAAGRTWTDVGLHEDGQGWFVGLGSRTPLVTAALDLVYALEYVQKAGAQPTAFVDPITGFTNADAMVTLHYAQPMVSVDLTAVPFPYPRPYAGASMALKLWEHWSDFPGTPSTA